MRSAVPPACVGLALVAALFATSAAGQPRTWLTLTVSVTGGTLEYPGGSCAATCPLQISQGATILLRARPLPGYLFSHWSGACVGTAPECLLAPDTSESAGALFGQEGSFRPPPGSPPPYLNVTVSGDGRVTGKSRGPINCGRNYARSGCLAPVRVGPLTLTAQAESGHQFKGWSDRRCHGGPICRIHVKHTGSLSAAFTG